MPFRQRLLARSDLQLWFLICWTCACFQSEDSFRLDAVFNMLSGPADFGDTAEFQEFEKNIPKWTFGYRLANVLETGHIAAIALIQTCRLVNESNGLDVPPASRSCVHSTSKQKILTEYKYVCSVLRLWDPLHNPLRSVISRTRTVCCVVFLANSRAIGCKKTPIRIWPILVIQTLDMADRNHRHPNTAIRTTARYAPLLQPAAHLTTPTVGPALHQLQRRLIRQTGVCP